MSLPDRTFPVTVAEIGDFVFRKRRVPDQVRIEAAARRMLDGDTDDAELRHIAMAWATLQVLTVEAPEKWDLEEIDPLDAADTAKMWAVWKELRAEEDRRFRRA